MSDIPSIYKEQKELPAWVKKENKYDKYGSRSSVAGVNAGVNNGVSRAQSARGNIADDTTDKYSKYGLSGEDRASRIRRSDGNDELTRKRNKAYGDRYNSSASPGGGSSGSPGAIAQPEEAGQDNSGAVASDIETNPELLAYTNLQATNPSNSYYQTFQSNIKRNSKDINNIIRSHYNQRTYQSKYQGNRTKSPIIKLRNFNNIIKYILLGEFCKPVEENAPFRLLDLCCGKGGDLNKMEFIKVDEYIGIDISDGSIREAFSRYEKNKVHFIQHNRTRDSRKYNFESFFATGDLFSKSVPDILEPNFPGIIENLFPVDSVSIQFSLHYAFETEDKIKCLINNVSKSLKPGGKFVGTIPSSDFIKYKIKKNMTPDMESFKFGNELYQVKFHELPPEDGDFNANPYGNGYNYSLTDAIDDVPEYVVPFETLRKICEDHQLTLKLKKNFIEFFNQQIPQYFKKLNNNLIQSIKRSDGKYGVEGLEKEAIEFYLVFVFEKN